MDSSEYGVMRRCEDEHWWYVGLHELVFWFLVESVKMKESPIVLDAGCGTGGLLGKNRSWIANFIGMEFSHYAFQQLATRNLPFLIQADLLRVPFQANQFDAISSQDVLCVFEHTAVESAMREMVRTLKPGGHLVMNLPAYQWMLSDHDRFVGNKSRFYHKRVVAQLHSMGMTVEYQGYRNVLIFPVVVLFRQLKMLMRRSQEIQSSDVKLPVKPLNWLMTMNLRIENRLVRHGVRFPFGLSLFVVAKKN